MTLFTKKNCGKCEYVKDHVDLKQAGVTVKVLSNENYEALAELAWHELVTVAETTMPILVLDNDTSITGAIKIKNYLLEIIQKGSSANC
jgi:glutaredoxin